MEVILQMKIKETKNYYNYLKENSKWFKELNRSTLNYSKFVDFLKEHYHLRVTDKISDAIDSIELLSNVVDALK